jgi:flagellar biosynthesis protein FlhA
MATLQKLLKHTDLMLGVGLFAIVAMLVLPLPHWLLDLGLVGAMAMALIILLVSVNVSDPLEFSVFPSVLLLTTLYRLALSIAATKLILGTGSAGHVIETFGNFVMGGDFVVGFVAFIILMIVQFIVITNGAGRVSEVVARFTLDAMPGKQMAIDADLGAGLIDEEGARARRQHVKREADFYGAMDGASKFIKGDAIASILITVVNIIGGFAVGFMRGQGDPLQVLQTYALLSVGEGLVSQLPALLISTASGLMVTRAGQEKSMGSEVTKQVLGQPKAIGLAGITLTAMAFVPGFPMLMFMAAGGLCFFAYRVLGKDQARVAKEAKDKKAEGAKAPAHAAAPDSPVTVLPPLNPVEIEIGHALTRLADVRVGGDLSDRVKATRSQIGLELGYVMPMVRIRDSVHIGAREYVVKIRGEEVARGEIVPDGLLAVDSGAVLTPVLGTPTKDPVFNLDALWISDRLREQAERSGYTVIEPSAVISTHLSEVVKQYAAELLSRQDVVALLDKAKEENAAVVDELVPNVLNVGDVQKVLQHLLRERVPIRDLVTILETMADYGSRTKDPEQLGELVRSAIARTITRQFVDQDNRLYCLTLDPSLERALVESVNVTSMGSALILEPDRQRDLVSRLSGEMEAAMAQGYNVVLLCSSQLRLALRRLLERYLPTLSVLAYNEVAPKAEVEFVGQIKPAAA